MTADARCREIEARMTEAFLDRGEIGGNDSAHLDTCPRCRATRRELCLLAESFEAPVIELSPARADTALAAARETLIDPDGDAIVDDAPGMPPGFGRELLRLLAYAALPLPLLVLGYTGLARFGAELLADWLPTFHSFLAPAVGVAVFGVAASWLGLVYGSLPFVAHRRALRRNEVIA